MPTETEGIEFKDLDFGVFYLIDKQNKKVFLERTIFDGHSEESLVKIVIDNKGKLEFIGNYEHPFTGPHKLGYKRIEVLYNKALLPSVKNFFNQYKKQIDEENFKILK
ncbi:MAG: hypothetical protein KKF48_04910 [Nanoarchaeota archaeon]|nr:hypothetical protein [Nanoarchaeota archaeon]MBU1028357.1 hypothetical protein [Nanoarchaeota archaeon]